MYCIICLNEKRQLSVFVSHFILRWPKSVTAISICSRQFQFAHGNFNLLTAISICSRQFQFAHGNFSLLTAISVCSRQFQFAHGNFSLLTAIGHREEPGRGNLDAALWVIFFLVLCWRSDSEIHENSGRCFVEVAAVQLSRISVFVQNVVLVS